MKYLPVALIVGSFIIICIGAYLKAEHNPLGRPMILGGLIGEFTFIIMNRLMMKKGSK